MSTLFFNLRWAFRSLLRSPAFSLTVILTMGLGIGANTTIFSLIERQLLRPLPLGDSARLMVVTEFKDEGFDNFSWPDFLDIERDTTSFSGLAAMRNDSINLTGDGEPERIRVGRVTWKLFEVAGVRPLLGRGFTPEEGQQTGPKSAVLTHAFWKRRFGANAALLGQSLHLDGEDVPVVGVLPENFRMPYQVGSAELFMPLRLTPDQQKQRGSHFLGAIGRLKPGLSPLSAKREVDTVLQRLGQTYPETTRGYQSKVVPLQEEVTENARPILYSLMGAVLFVLLIACANVANLLLARSAARERDISIRAALGAGRQELMGHMLAEAMILAFLGALVGLVLARYTMVGLLGILPFSPIAGTGVDGSMVGFSLILACISVFLFALLPAWQASRVNLESSLREGAKDTGGPAQKRLRRTLVTAEVALATTLLAGAGLMIRSLSALQQVDPGFQPAGVLTAGISLPKLKYDSPAMERAFLVRLLQRAQQGPGVVSAAAVDTLPLSGSTGSSSYSLDGQAGDAESPHVERHRVTPAFFEAMGIPILRGRTFEAQEGRAALVSASFAERHWPGQDPTGHRVSISGAEGPWMTIVGVVGDMRTEGLDKAPTPQLFLPMLDPEGEGSRRSITLLLKGSGVPRALTPGLKAALRELDPDLPLSQIRPMSAILESDLREHRAQGLLFSAFGLVALVLAGVGVYGVTSFLVAQRTREIGIRMALGAQIRDVLKLIFAQGLRTLGLGLALGLIAALGLGHLVRAQLYGITPQDPLTLVLVGSILGFVGLLACLIPALRAAQVDPSVALRSE